MSLQIPIPTTCEENAALQTKLLMAMAEILGLTPEQILSQGV